MANPILVTLFRRQLEAGWVSTYFINSPDLNVALGDAQALNSAEMALLGTNTECQRISVSQLGVKRDINAGPAITQVGTSPDSAAGSVDPNLALAITMQGAPTVLARKFLRGLPSGLVTVFGGRGSFTVSAAFKTAYDAWKTAMTGKVVLVPGKRSGMATFPAIPFATIPVLAVNDVLDLSIRRAGRPFPRRPGRRAVGA